MFCTNCGSTIDDNAAVCIHCGAVTPRGMTMGVGGMKAPVDPNEPANGGFIVLSLLVPIFGIIYGAIEKGNGKERAGKAYLTAAIIAMILWIVVPIIITILTIALPTLLMMLALVAGTNEAYHAADTYSYTSSLLPLLLW